MGLERMRLPDAMHRAVRETELLGQIPATPVSHPSRRRFQRHGHHLGGLARLDAAGTTAAGPIRQTGQTGFGNATPDTTHLDRGIAGSSGDFGTWDVIGNQQHGSCTSAESEGTDEDRCNRCSSRRSLGDRMMGREWLTMTPPARVVYMAYILT